MSDRIPTRQHRRPSLQVIALSLGIALASTLAYAATTMPDSMSAAPSWIERMHGHSHAELHAHFEQVLTDAGTSPAQRQQIDGIMKAAMADEHADMHAYHDSCARLKDLLVAPQIDERALTSVRADQDRLALALSRRLSDTAIRIAQVLTPAQRRDLGAQIDQMIRGHLAHHAG
jgi:Spy/CpxP family protein refolding chaperone